MGGLDGEGKDSLSRRRLKPKCNTKRLLEIIESGCEKKKAAFTFKKTLRHLSERKTNSFFLVFFSLAL